MTVCYKIFMEVTKKMTLGKNLAELMKFKKIGQVELANQVGVVQSAVSLWINDKREPDYKTLFLLCKILDTTPNELLGWED